MALNSLASKKLNVWIVVENIILKNLKKLSKKKLLGQKPSKPLKMSILADGAIKFVAVLDGFLCKVDGRFLCIVGEGFLCKVDGPHL